MLRHLLSNVSLEELLLAGSGQKSAPRTALLNTDKAWLGADFDKSRRNRHRALQRNWSWERGSQNLEVVQIRRHHWSNSVTIGPDLVDVGPELVEFAPDLADVGPSTTDFGPNICSDIEPMLISRCWPISGQL